MNKNKLLTVIIICVMGVVAVAACILIPLTATKTPEIDTDSTSVSVASDRLNVLIAGCDRMSGLSDVIMLLSVDEQSGSATVLQIPRDTYAEYTSSSYKKLNGAYGALGAEGFCEFLSRGLGIKIDRYLIMSPDAVVGAVDALGGVEIYLEEPMRYSDPEQGLYISLDAGRQTLDGKSAEQFIRYRSGYADGDLGRLDAQKKFLCGLLVSVRKNTDPVTLARLTAVLLGKTETNITPSDGIYLTEVLLSFNTSSMRLITAPGEAVIAKTSGASDYSLSAPSMERILCEFFGAEADSFDREGLFKNEKYESFKEAYEKNSSYRVYTVKKLLEES